MNSGGTAKPSATIRVFCIEVLEFTYVQQQTQRSPDGKYS